MATHRAFTYPPPRTAVPTTKGSSRGRKRAPVEPAAEPDAVDAEPQAGDHPPEPQESATIVADEPEGTDPPGETP